MSHRKPHVNKGLCDCECKKCTISSPDGTQQLCICKDCDPIKCGLHTWLPPQD